MEALVQMMTKLADKVDALDNKINSSQASTDPPPQEQNADDEAEAANQDLRHRMDDLLDIGATGQVSTISPVTTLSYTENKDRKKGKPLRSGRELHAENEYLFCEVDFERVCTDASSFG